jgi:hypothetical protein
VLFFATAIYSYDQIRPTGQLEHTEVRGSSFKPPLDHPPRCSCSMMALAFSRPEAGSARGDLVLAVYYRCTQVAAFDRSRPGPLRLELLAGLSSSVASTR